MRFRLIELLTFKTAGTLAALSLAASVCIGAAPVDPASIPADAYKDELYVAITLASCDGLPLEKTKKAVLSAMSTSFNTGYQLDTDKRPLKEHTGAEVKNRGTLPVLVARVGCTIKCPAIAGMNYIFRDYHMKEIGTGKINRTGVLAIPPDKPLFVVEFNR